MKAGSLKRSASPIAEPPAKRTRTTYHGIFDDKSALESFQHVADGSEDAPEPSYISGIIRTISREDKKWDVNIRELDGNEMVQVVVSGHALKRMQRMGVDLHGGDTVALALRGASVFARASSFKIRFDEGIMLQITRHAAQMSRSLVDTWKENDLDWFDASQPIQLGVVPQRATEPPTPAPTSPPTKVSHDGEDGDSELVAELSRGQRRRARAKVHKQQQANANHKPKPAVVENQPTPLTPKPTVERLTLSSKPNAPAPVVSPHSAASGPQAGPSPSYSPSSILSNFVSLEVAPQQKGRFNVIGIVHVAGVPSESRNGDWFNGLRLMDASICSAENIDNPISQSVNLFSHKYAEWLPNPTPGDVLILYNLKTNNRSALVGYPDQLRWSLYQPVTGVFRHSDTVPTSETISGRILRPFHDPSEEELDYCKSLLRWKKEAEMRTKPKEHVHHCIATTSTVTTNEKPTRIHRLISDVHPGIQPHGSFNAIVLVLHRFERDRYTQLYVTDYSKNDKLYTYSSSWCPDGLNDRVLYIECWGDAKRPADMVELGQVYALDDVRMKLARNGSLEGKLNDAKIDKLDRNRPGDNVHFKTFLEREKEWKAIDERKRVQRSFKTIGASVTAISFNCVAEVLSLHDDSLFVTDYSPNATLLDAVEDFSVHTVSYNKPYLAGCVLPIRLHEPEHASWADTVAVPTTLCLVHGVKIKVGKNGKVRGYLADTGAMISLLEPDDATYANLIGALFDRKEELTGKKVKNRVKAQEKQKVAPASPVKAPKAVEDVEVGPQGIVKKVDSANVKRPTFSPRMERPKYKRYKTTTVQALRDDEPCPGNYQVTAHIVDFRPMSLDQCVATWCAKCRENIPSKYQACPACADATHEYVQMSYRMFMYLAHEDDTETEIYVGVNDESPLFDDLERVNLEEDEEAYKALCERLKPMTGLITPHYKTDPPTLTFFIQTRRNLGGKRMHFLQGFRTD